MSVFLKATWQNLIQIIYLVDAEQIRKFLPDELEVELFQGKAQLILSALEFRQTRVKGLKIPFHVNFPELNLRVKVLKDQVPGVFFLRQYVPKHCIAVVARRIYNEPYESFPMEFEVNHIPGTDEDMPLLECTCKIWKKEHTLVVKVFAEENMEMNPAQTSPDTETYDSSDADIITGFGQNEKFEIIQYTIEQKKRSFLPVKEWSIVGDIGKIFDDILPEGLIHEPAEVQFSYGQVVRITQPL